MNTLFKLIKDSFAKIKIPKTSLPSFLIHPVNIFKKYFHQKLLAPKPLFKPTLYLYHPFSQVVYNIAERNQKVTYQREKVYFSDGGHVCLDWFNPTHKQQKQQEMNEKTPICFVMHGLTGGSDMNYIKVLLQEAERNMFRGVCMNSRGIGIQMTSSKPFTWIDFDDLHVALDKVKTKYPDADIYMIGTSFGSNYLTRYLLQKKKIDVKGYVGLGTPFDVPVVMNTMSPICQKFFVKRYINQTILKHPKMYDWHSTGVVNMDQVTKSTNLKQFYEKLLPLTGMSSVQQLFNVYSIGKEIKNLNVPSLFINSIDDPIVTTKGIPEELKVNPHIKYLETTTGGHLCWYEGIIPKRWYPKPTFNFLQTIRKS